MTETVPDRAASPSRRRDVLVAGSAGVFAAFMVGMAYAAVPLYDWFCRATGFGGTTQVAAGAPGQVLDRKVTVRFDANIGAGLAWQFEPERTSIKARLGEVVTVNYRAANLTARETHGIAGYNVTPLSVGIFFQKINCFCFTDQTLQAGEKRDMAVVFYIDPKMAQDADGKDVDTITLSYTFHPLRDAQRPVADNVPANRPGRI
jgi:cytochrome c oxidase assembly protein subunit 11